MANQNIVSMNAAVASVVDPQIFVIGGGVSKAGDILFKYIEPSYKRCAFGPCKQTKFALAKLGNDAGIYFTAGRQSEKTAKTTTAILRSERFRR